MLGKRLLVIIGYIWPTLVDREGEGILTGRHTGRVDIGYWVDFGPM